MTQCNVKFGEYNMKSHNRYYHRSWVDDYLWRVSLDLEKDPLWRGRFYVRRIKSDMEWFHDGSGGLMYVTIRIYDKKTHKRKDINTDAVDMQMHMFMWINEFIVNDVQVWENEKPYEDHTDWRKQK